MGAIILFVIPILLAGFWVEFSTPKTTPRWRDPIFQGWGMERRQ